MNTQKIILKGFLAAAGVLAIGVLAFAFASFNFISYDDSAFTHTISDDGYYQESYQESRKAFLTLAEKLKLSGKNVSLSSITVPSSIDKDLTVNCLYIPAGGQKKKLLIMSSGVHGIEGYVGSAVQQMFIKEILPGIDTTNMGIVIIHSVNPYGFKYNRRVTENNVDMNRNSDTSKKLFTNKNNGYTKLNTFLNPVEKCNPQSINNLFFLITAVKKIVQESMGALRQAILQGQYEFPDGLYFGGKDFEPQQEPLKEYLKQIMDDYSASFTLDLHTGYGERGKLHLFPNPVKDKTMKARMEAIFKGYHIDWGDSDDFYTVKGDFIDMVGKLAQGKPYVPRTIEFGTMNSQTTIGSVKSIHIMILENQGFHHGYVNKKSEQKIKKMIREMYYPSSPRYRSQCLKSSRDLLPKVIKRYSEMEI